MRNKAFLAITIIIVLLQATVSAKTKPVKLIKTATQSGNSIDEEEIKKLKDKVATKVAELRKARQDITTGFVTKINDNSFTIADSNGKNYQIKIDESLTKIYNIKNNQTKEAEKKNFKEGDYILATGPVADNAINANAVYKDTQFKVKSGIITEINKEEFYLRITTIEKDNYILDIEKDTKQLILDTDSFELKKVGFSKIKVGDTVHSTFKNLEKEEKDRYSADKIVIIPQEYFETTARK